MYWRANQDIQTRQRIRKIDLTVADKYRHRGVEMLWTSNGELAGQSGGWHAPKQKLSMALGSLERAVGDEETEQKM
jgi:hypothetical protein